MLSPWIFCKYMTSEPKPLKNTALPREINWIWEKTSHPAAPPGHLLLSQAPVFLTLLPGRTYMGAKEKPDLPYT